MLVVDEVHPGEGGDGPLIFVDGAEEDNGREIEDEEESRDEERGGEEHDREGDGERAGGEPVLEEEDEGDGDEDVERGAGVDERREVGHVAEAVHLVEGLVGTGSGEGRHGWLRGRDWSLLVARGFREWA